MARLLVDQTQATVYEIRDQVRHALGELHNLRQGLEAPGSIGIQLALKLVRKAEEHLHQITD